MTGLRWPVVAVTGPRPHHLSKPGRDWTRIKLVAGAVWLRDQCSTVTGLSGMALGVDQWWAQSVLDAGLKLGAYLPCPDQDARWYDTDRKRWAVLLEQADHRHVTAAAYTGPQVLHDRNRHMLAAAAAVLAVWDPGRRAGGTWSAVRTAHRLRLPGVHLDPVARTVRVIRDGRWIAPHT